MPRPHPTWVYHFTRVEHLPTIIKHGLQSDTRAQALGLLQIEVGQRSIKGQRAETPVRCAPGGRVADYVPFYFAPRSPMMHNIASGKVPTYQAGCERLIYLATTTERIKADGLAWVATDRNAALRHAEHTVDDARLGAMVSWDVMAIWVCTPDQGDRIERRMAEFLVHEAVPFKSILAVGVRSDHMAAEVNDILGRHNVTMRALVRPKWYF